MTRKKAKTEAQEPVRVPRDVTREEIEKRAYQHYCDRGCAPGGDVDDWLAAERELLGERPDAEDTTTAE